MTLEINTVDWEKLAKELTTTTNVFQNKKREGFSAKFETELRLQLGSFDQTLDALPAIDAFAETARGEVETFTKGTNSIRLRVDDADLAKHLESLDRTSFEIIRRVLNERFEDPPTNLERIYAPIFVRTEAGGTLLLRVLRHRATGSLKLGVRVNNGDRSEILKVDDAVYAEMRVDRRLLPIVRVRGFYIRQDRIGLDVILEDAMLFDLKHGADALSSDEDDECEMSTIDH